MDPEVRGPSQASCSVETPSEEPGEGAATSASPESDTSLLPLLTMLSLPLFTRFFRTHDLQALEGAIDYARESLSSLPPGDDSKAVFRYALSELLLCRLELLGQQTDVEEVVDSLNQALTHIPDHAGMLGRRRLCLQPLAKALHHRFWITGSRQDLCDSIERGCEALAFRGLSRDERAPTLAVLATSLLSSFMQSSSPYELDQSIENAREAVSCCPLDSSFRPAALDVLSLSLLARYELRGTIADLDASVAFAKQEVLVCPLDRPGHIRALITLSNALLALFEHTGRTKDIADSLALANKAETLTAAAIPLRSEVSDILSRACLSAFTQDGLGPILELAIIHGEQRLLLHPTGHPKRPRSLLNLGNAKMTRFVVSGRQEDINDSIANLSQAAECSQPMSPLRVVALHKLSSALRHRFLAYGSSEDLEQSIAHGREALSICDPHAPIRTLLLSGLASSLGERLSYSGDHNEDFNLSMGYFGDAIECCTCARGASPYLERNVSFLKFVCGAGSVDMLQKRNLLQGVLEDCPPRSLHRPIVLGILASLISAQYEVSGRPEDLQMVATVVQTALSLCPSGAPARPGLLLTLASALYASFNRSRNTDAFTRCLNILDTALSLCSPHHPLRYEILSQYAKLFTSRFEQTANPEDDLKSIEYLQDALSLCPRTSPLRPSLVYNLAFSFTKRFGRTERMDDLERAVEYSQETLTLYPPTHRVHAQVLCDLGQLLGQRFMMKKDLADLDKSIEHFQQALSFAGPDPAFRIKLLSGLVNTLRFRYEATKDEEDIGKGLDFGETCLSLCPPGHRNHADVLGLLAQSQLSRYQVRKNMEALELGIGHLQSALSYTPCQTSPAHLSSLTMLSAALKERFQASGQRQDLERCIAYVVEALDHRPPGHPDRSHNAVGGLAWALKQRFELDGSLEDLDQAIDLLRERVEMPLDPDDPDSRVSRTLDLATVLNDRVERTRREEDLQESVQRGYDALAICPTGHPLRRRVLDILATSVFRRFQHTARPEDLVRAVALLREALSLEAAGSPGRMLLLMNLSSALEMRQRITADADCAEEIMRCSEEAYLACPPEHADRVSVVHHLATAYLERYKAKYRAKVVEPKDLNQAIDYYHDSLSLSPEKSPIHLHRVNDLIGALFLRYARGGRLEDLDECIDRARITLANCPPDHQHPERQRTLGILASALWIRYPRTRDQEDILNTILFLKESALSETASSLQSQLQSAMLWASVAHSENHYSTVQAYRTCLELLERLLMVAPTLEMQHELLQERLWSLPLDAAAHAINQGDLKLAVETLEQGRALLWSQVRRLRTPLDKVANDETLAPLRDTFLAKSRALEAIGTSANPFLSAPAGNEAADPYGAMLESKRRLSAELRDIIERIRAKVPDFLRLPSYDKLKAVSAEGPVVVVNHSKYRSDAIIIGPGDSLSCVKLPNEFYMQTIDLANNLLETRQTLRTAPKKYDQALRRALDDLGELLVDPVLEKLGELGVEQGSRMWWCPTSVVSALPLHAAGPLRTIGSRTSKGKTYLSDLYITSYTPTLTSLIEARSVDPELAAPASHSLLAIATPDKSLAAVASEIDILREQFEDRLALAIDSGCNRDAVIAGLKQHRWVHFACHGTLTPGAPFNSAFILSKDHKQRLTLLDIVGAGLHNADLAVLSACHTAALTAGGAIDEVLHLAAAMHFSGFRSVVGTMWQLSDQDGPTFADTFYSDLFAGQRNSRETSSGFRGAARALNAATKELRRRKVNLERWVNFVHIGA